MVKPNNPPVIEVTFWGTRGSVSTPGRITKKYGGNTPCVSVRVDGSVIIFDAGTGIRNLGLELLGQGKDNGRPLSLHLFLSHTHWDHIQGLPFFQPIYEKATELTIYGSPKKGKFLESILKGQMDLEYFPIGLSQLEAALTIQEISSRAIRIGPMIVDWQEQHLHPGGSVRYRISIGTKRLVYATDVELDLLFDENGDPEQKKKQLDEYLDFIRGADLLIADGQYSESEYPSKKGWGHTSVPVLMALAQEAEVKQVAVFHHDPQHSDAFLDELWRKHRKDVERAGRVVTVFWAREGMTLAI